MTLQQRVLKMGINCDHKVIQVPSSYFVVEQHPGDENKKFPDLQFQEDGSLIIAGENFTTKPGETLYHKTVPKNLEDESEEQWNSEHDHPDDSSKQEV